MDKQVASEMGISVVTVRFYWHKIEGKVGARTRLQAVYRLCCDGHLTPKDGPEEERIQRLSEKERHMLCLAVAKGYKDEELVKELGISLATVRHYWGRVKQKVKARSRIQAVYLLCCDGQLEEKKEGS